MKKEITELDLIESNNAGIAAIAFFKEKAGPVYEKLGMPLSTIDDAARALLGQLLEGTIRLYGINFLKNVVNHVYEQTKIIDAGEACTIDTETGKVKKHERS